MFLSWWNPRVWLRAGYLLLMYLPVAFRLWWSGPTEQTTEALRGTVERSGPTIIKMAQWLSQRPDVVGRDVALVLGSLRDRCRPTPLEDLLPVIGDYRDRLTHIDETPLGVGSIAQVHRARIKTDDPTQTVDVVIKIRHPGIITTMETDLTILSHLLRKTRWFDRVDVTECLRNLSRQTDLRHEAENLERLSSVISVIKGNEVRVPRLIHVADTFLVETFCPGSSIAELKTVDPDRYVRMRRLLLTSVVSMIRRGFLHGDLHDGNVLCDGETLWLVDFGLMVPLSERDRAILKELAKGYHAFYTEGDPTRLIDATQNFTSPLGPTQRDHLRALLLRSTIRRGDRTLFLSPRITELVTTLVDFLHDNELRVSGEILSVLSTIPIVEANVTAEFGVDLIGAGLKF